MAAEKGYDRVVSALVANPNVDVNAVEDNGRTALDFAAEKGFDKVASILVALPKLNVNSVGQYGRTALIWAAIYGKHKVIDVLQTHSQIDANIKLTQRSCYAGEALINYDKCVSALIN